VNSLVKNTLLKSGIDPKDYSGHSLRAGFVTSAAKAGKRLDIIMRQTGHKQVNTVMRYIRHVKLFEENPADGLGL
jgi:integrase